MARFPDQFLEDIRQRLPVSAVIGRRVQLKRAGSEFKGLSPFNKESTPSFTVNDEKGFYHDFSSGKHGNIFQFEMETTGCTFTDAVETLAQLAGLPLPSGRENRHGLNGRSNGQSAPLVAPADDPEDPGPSLENAPQAPRVTTQRKITATYDYTDADGSVLYQVVRSEWEENGETKKTFGQRRPAPGKDGEWLWGLAPGEYLRPKFSSSRDWYVATDQRRLKWKGAERLIVEEEVAHGLYRFPELREERAQPSQERQTAWIPEGEKDCDMLADWGLLSTTNSGGAKHWLPHHAEELRDFDVVVLLDNDTAGRERGHKVAASLRGIASRVRLLDWREHWGHVPEKGDVTDWRNLASGTREKLFKIAEQLPAWTPQAPESTFGALKWKDINAPGKEFEWLIKGIMPRGAVSVWYGDWGTGKSFLMLDAALSVARGVSWFGHRVPRQGLAIYQAGEGGLGYKSRLRAYERMHGIKDNLPFVLLSLPVDLYAKDADTERLIAEIRGWQGYHDATLELIVIDTLSAATPGANENASEDMTKVLQRCFHISRETSAHVALVHHTPKTGGTARGWSGVIGNVDAAVFIEDTDDIEAEFVGNKTHERTVHRFTVTKQKDAPSGLKHSFVLPQFILGHDADGDPQTSCTVRVAQNDRGPSTGSIPPGYVRLPGNDGLIFRQLINALAETGTYPPVGLRAPKDELACEVTAWAERLTTVKRATQPDLKKADDAARKAIERAIAKWGANGKPGHLVTERGGWVWRTGLLVDGIDAPPKPAEPLRRPDEAAEEPIPGDEELPF